MCFSPEASFAASGVIGAIGAATLFQVREARAVPFAALPMLFALHQLIEGFVWLGLQGRIGQAALEPLVLIYMLYAKATLPLLIPLSVMLIEPAGWRRKAMAALTLGGGIIFAWMVYAIIAFPTSAMIAHHSIRYVNNPTGGMLLSVTYVLVTCGALILSGHRTVRLFGLLNLAGLSVVVLVKNHAFASVWCFYAALLSIMLYFQFRGRAVAFGAGA